MGGEYYLNLTEPIRISLNPINFKYIARITLKNPYANVLAILEHRSNLPSTDIHSNKIFTLIFTM
jgi:hypothetical protein